MLASPLDHATIFAAFAETAKRYPDRPFLNVPCKTAENYGTAAGEISYGEMWRRVDDKTATYRTAGYGADHRVGIMLENRPAFFEHWLALNALGVSIVPINPDLRAAELRYLVDHSELALVVAIPSRRNELLQAGAPMVVGPEDAIPTAVAAYKMQTLDQSAEAALLYTSGTTGLPKGCVLSNAYFLNCGDWYKNVGGACALTESGERMITPLPLFHMNALACSVMAMIAVGGCLSVVDRFHPSTWWEDVRETRATVMHYLGVMPAMLMRATPSRTDTRHDVRFGFGAGVEQPLHTAFESRFNIPLIEAWAMTETGNGAVIAASHGNRHVGSRCFGAPSPAVEVQLIADNGQLVKPGCAGELLVRRAGANPRFGFFDRYLKNPEETAKVWRGGWFHTGDIARQNPDGTYVFVDRKKNLIRRAGENIAAAEVEGVLNRHPLVAASAVAATPDPLRGDEVFAVIKLADPANADNNTAEKIVAHCLDQLAYFKAPGYIAFVPDLPLTSTNKIQRGAMQKIVADLRDDPKTVTTLHLKKRRDV